MSAGLPKLFRLRGIRHTPQHNHPSAARQQFHFAERECKQPAVAAQGDAPMISSQI